jgi:hypothetical protein
MDRLLRHSRRKQGAPAGPVPNATALRLDSTLGSEIQGDPASVWAGRSVVFCLEPSPTSRHLNANGALQQREGPTEPFPGGSYGTA